MENELNSLMNNIPGFSKNDLNVDDELEELNEEVSNEKHTHKNSDELLEEEINRLNIECYHIIRTLSINKNLTGYQKEMSQYRLSHLTESINSIKSQIYDIKKFRYASQMEKFNKKLK